VVVVVGLLNSLNVLVEAAEAVEVRVMELLAERIAEQTLTLAE
jgi:hypothetical protein